MASASASEDSSIIDEKGPSPPAKQGHGVLRWLRYRCFSIYRRLFSAVFLVNVAVLVALLFASGARRWPMIAHTATAVSTNLFVAIIMRQDHVVNLLFGLFCAVPLSAPLVLRRWAAKIYHLGGLHSGCALAAFFWYMLFTAVVTREYIANSRRELVREPAILVVTYLLLVLLLGIIILTLPRFRTRYHNTFEATHRFGGWLALALFWVQIILVANASRKLIPHQSLDQAIGQSPSFWLLLLASASISLPWLCLRRVTVDAMVLSDHAVRLNFAHRPADIGSAVRLSDRPLKEWHAFAAFSSPSRNGFSVVISNAGDWTKKQIQHPPRRLWIRGVPTSGVLRVSTLFRRVVLVTTGSGIGPCLSVIYSGQVPCRVLWSTPHPLQTFGEDIHNAVLAADPQAIIHNTRTQGRPDVVALAYTLYAESGAEAVVVISNPALTKKVVYGMESRGVPAYGPLWDS
ncbi:MAG: hypothetical protein M1826_001695 [Phylliscum demangeonii]|nr:MAG: hypothetical protein M1826_001695 [Phylliscum demangeonii]